QATIFVENRSDNVRSVVYTALAKGGGKAALWLTVCLLLSGFVAAGAPVAGVTQKGLEEISALLQEKASWTPAKTKLESQLSHAVKNARGQAFAPKAKGLKLGFAVPPDGHVLVDITA